MTYRIIVRETLSHEVEVLASSKEDADKQAIELE